MGCIQVIRLLKMEVLEVMIFLLIRYGMSDGVQHAYVRMRPTLIVHIMSSCSIWEIPVFKLLSLYMLMEMTG